MSKINVGSTSGENGGKKGFLDDLGIYIKVLWKVTKWLAHILNAIAQSLGLGIVIIVIFLIMLVIVLVDIIIKRIANKIYLKAQTKSGLIKVVLEAVAYYFKIVLAEFYYSTKVACDVILMGFRGVTAGIVGVASGVDAVLSRNTGIMSNQAEIINMFSEPVSSRPSTPKPIIIKHTAEQEFAINRREKLKKHEQMADMLQFALYQFDVDWKEAMAVGLARKEELEKQEEIEKNAYKKGEPSSDAIFDLKEVELLVGKIKNTYYNPYLAAKNRLESLQRIEYEKKADDTAYLNDVQAAKEELFKIYMEPQKLREIIKNDKEKSAANNGIEYNDEKVEYIVQMYYDIDNFQDSIRDATKALLQSYIDQVDDTFSRFVGGSDGFTNETIDMAISSMVQKRVGGYGYPKQYYEKESEDNETVIGAKIYSYEQTAAIAPEDLKLESISNEADPETGELVACLTFRSRGGAREYKIMGLEELSQFFTAKAKKDYADFQNIAIGKEKVIEENGVVKVYGLANNYDEEFILIPEGGAIGYFGKNVMSAKEREKVQLKYANKKYKTDEEEALVVKSMYGDKYASIIVEVNENRSNRQLQVAADFIIPVENKYKYRYAMSEKETPKNKSRIYGGALTAYDVVKKESVGTRQIYEIGTVLDDNKLYNEKYVRVSESISNSTAAKTSETEVYSTQANNLIEYSEPIKEMLDSIDPYWDAKYYELRDDFDFENEDVAYLISKDHASNLETLNGTFKILDKKKDIDRANKITLCKLNDGESTTYTQVDDISRISSDKICVKNQEVWDNFLDLWNSEEVQLVMDNSKGDIQKILNYKLNDVVIIRANESLTEEEKEEKIKEIRLEKIKANISNIRGNISGFECSGTICDSKINSTNKDAINAAIAKLCADNMVSDDELAEQVFQILLNEAGKVKAQQISAILKNNDTLWKALIDNTELIEATDIDVENFELSLKAYESGVSDELLQEAENKKAQALGELNAVNLEITNKEKDLASIGVSKKIIDEAKKNDFTLFKETYSETHSRYNTIYNGLQELSELATEANNKGNAYKTADDKVTDLENMRKKAESKVTSYMNLLKTGIGNVNTHSIDRILVSQSDVGKHISTDNMVYEESRPLNADRTASYGDTNYKRFVIRKSMPKNTNDDATKQTKYTVARINTLRLLLNIVNNQRIGVNKSNGRTAYLSNSLIVGIVPEVSYDNSVEIIKLYNLDKKRIENYAYRSDWKVNDGKFAEHTNDAKAILKKYTPAAFGINNDADTGIIQQYCTLDGVIYNMLDRGEYLFRNDNWKKTKILPGEIICVSLVDVVKEDGSGIIRKVVPIINESSSPYDILSAGRDGNGLLKVRVKNLENLEIQEIPSVIAFGDKITAKLDLQYTPREVIKNPETQTDEEKFGQLYIYNYMKWNKDSYTSYGQANTSSCGDYQQLNKIRASNITSDERPDILYKFERVLPDNTVIGFSGRRFVNQNKEVSGKTKDINGKVTDDNIYFGDLGDTDNVIISPEDCILTKAGWDGVSKGGWTLELTSLDYERKYKFSSLSRFSSWIDAVLSLKVEDWQNSNQMYEIDDYTIIRKGEVIGQMGATGGPEVNDVPLVAPETLRVVKVGYADVYVTNSVTNETTIERQYFINLENLQGTKRYIIGDVSGFENVHVVKKGESDNPKEFSLDAIKDKVEYSNCKLVDSLGESQDALLNELYKRVYKEDTEIEKLNNKIRNTTAETELKELKKEKAKLENTINAGKGTIECYKLRPLYIYAGETIAYAKVDKETATGGQYTGEVRYKLRTKISPKDITEGYVYDNGNNKTLLDDINGGQTGANNIDFLLNLCYSFKKSSNNNVANKKIINGELINTLSSWDRTVLLLSGINPGSDITKCFKLYTNDVNKEELFQAVHVDFVASKLDSLVSEQFNQKVKSKTGEITNLVKIRETNSINKDEFDSDNKELEITYIPGSYKINRIECYNKDGKIIGINELTYSTVQEDLIAQIDYYDIDNPEGINKEDVDYTESTFKSPSYSASVGVQLDNKNGTTHKIWCNDINKVAKVVLCNAIDAEMVYDMIDILNVERGESTDVDLDKTAVGAKEFTTMVTGYNVYVDVVNSDNISIYSIQLLDKDGNEIINKLVDKDMIVENSEGSGYVRYKVNVSKEFFPQLETLPDFTQVRVYYNGDKIAYWKPEITFASKTKDNSRITIKYAEGMNKLHQIRYFDMAGNEITSDIIVKKTNEQLNTFSVADAQETTKTVSPEELAGISIKDSETIDYKKYKNTLEITDPNNKLSKIQIIDENGNYTEYVFLKVVNAEKITDKTVRVDVLVDSSDGVKKIEYYNGNKMVLSKTIEEDERNDGTYEVELTSPVSKVIVYSVNGSIAVGNMETNSRIFGVEIGENDAKIHVRKGTKDIDEIILNYSATSKATVNVSNISAENKQIDSDGNIVYIINRAGVAGASQSFKNLDTVSIKSGDKIIDQYVIFRIQGVEKVDSDSNKVKVLLKMDERDTLEKLECYNKDGKLVEEKTMSKNEKYNSVVEITVDGDNIKFDEKITQVKITDKYGQIAECKALRPRITKLDIKDNSIKVTWQRGYNVTKCIKWSKGGNPTTEPVDDSAVAIGSENSHTIDISEAKKINQLIIEDTKGLWTEYKLIQINSIKSVPDTDKNVIQNGSKYKLEVNVESALNSIEVTAQRYENNKYVNVAKTTISGSSTDKFSGAGGTAIFKYDIRNPISKIIAKAGDNVEEYIGPTITEGLIYDEVVSFVKKGEAKAKQVSLDNPITEEYKDKLECTRYCRLRYLPNKTDIDNVKFFTDNGTNNVNDINTVIKQQGKIDILKAPGTSKNDKNSSYVEYFLNLPNEKTTKTEKIKTQYMVVYDSNGVGCKKAITDETLANSVFSMEGYHISKEDAVVKVSKKVKTEFIGMQNDAFTWDHGLGNYPGFDLWMFRDIDWSPGGHTDQLLLYNVDGLTNYIKNNIYKNFAPGVTNPAKPEDDMEGTLRPLSTKFANAYNGLKGKTFYTNPKMPDEYNEYFNYDCSIKNYNICDVGLYIEGEGGSRSQKSISIEKKEDNNNKNLYTIKKIGFDEYTYKKTTKLNDEYDTSSLKSTKSKEKDIVNEMKTISENMRNITNIRKEKIPLNDGNPIFWILMEQDGWFKTNYRQSWWYDTDDTVGTWHISMNAYYLDLEEEIQKSGFGLSPDEMNKVSKVVLTSKYNPGGMDKGIYQVIEHNFLAINEKGNTNNSSKKAGLYSVSDNLVININGADTPGLEVVGIGYDKNPIGGGWTKYYTSPTGNNLKLIETENNITGSETITTVNKSQGKISIPRKVDGSDNKISSRKYLNSVSIRGNNGKLIEIFGPEIKTMKNEELNYTDVRVRNIIEKANANVYNEGNTVEKVSVMKKNDTNWTELNDSKYKIIYSVEKITETNSEGKITKILANSGEEVRVRETLIRIQGKDFDMVKIKDKNGLSGKADVKATKITGVSYSNEKYTVNIDNISDVSKIEWYDLDGNKFVVNKNQVLARVYKGDTEVSVADNKVIWSDGRVTINSTFDITEVRIYSYDFENKIRVVSNVKGPVIVGAVYDKDLGGIVIDVDDVEWSDKDYINNVHLEKNGKTEVLSNLVTKEYNLIITTYTKKGKLVSTYKDKRITITLLGESDYDLLKVASIKIDNNGLVAKAELAGTLNINSVKPNETDSTKLDIAVEYTSNIKAIDLIKTNGTETYNAVKNGEDFILDNGNGTTQKITYENGIATFSLSSSNETVNRIKVTDESGHTAEIEGPTVIVATKESLDNGNRQLSMVVTQPTYEDSTISKIKFYDYNDREVEIKKVEGINKKGETKSNSNVSVDKLIELLNNNPNKEIVMEFKTSSLLNSIVKMKVVNKNGLAKQNNIIDSTEEANKLVISSVTASGSDKYKISTYETGIYKHMITGIEATTEYGAYVPVEVVDKDGKAVSLPIINDDGEYYIKFNANISKIRLNTKRTEAAGTRLEENTSWYNLLRVSDITLIDNKLQITVVGVSGKGIGEKSYITKKDNTKVVFDSSYFKEKQGDSDTMIITIPYTDDILSINILDGNEEEVFKIQIPNVEAELIENDNIDNNTKQIEFRLKVTQNVYNGISIPVKSEIGSIELYDKNNIKLEAPEELAKYYSSGVVRNIEENGAAIKIPIDKSSKLYSVKSIRVTNLNGLTSKVDIKKLVLNSISMSGKQLTLGMTGTPTEVLLKYVDSNTSTTIKSMNIDNGYATINLTSPDVNQIQLKDASNHIVASGPSVYAGQVAYTDSNVNLEIEATAGEYGKISKIEYLDSSGKTLTLKNVYDNNKKAVSGVNTVSPATDNYTAIIPINSNGNAESIKYVKVTDERGLTTKAKVELKLKITKVEIKNDNDLELTINKKDTQTINRVKYYELDETTGKTNEIIKYKNDLKWKDSDTTSQTITIPGIAGKVSSIRVESETEYDVITGPSSATATKKDKDNGTKEMSLSITQPNVTGGVIKEIRFYDNSNNQIDYEDISMSSSELISEIKEGTANIEIDLNYESDVIRNRIEYIRFINENGLIKEATVIDETSQGGEFKIKSVVKKEVNGMSYYLAKTNRVTDLTKDYEITEIEIRDRNDRVMSLSNIYNEKGRILPSKVASSNGIGHKIDNTFQLYNEDSEKSNVENYALIGYNEDIASITLYYGNRTGSSRYDLLKIKSIIQNSSNDDMTVHIGGINNTEVTEVSWTNERETEENRVTTDTNKDKFIFTAGKDSYTIYNDYSDYCISNITVKDKWGNVHKVSGPTVNLEISTNSETSKLKLNIKQNSNDDGARVKEIRFYDNTVYEGYYAVLNSQKADARLETFRKDIIGARDKEVVLTNVVEILDVLGLNNIESIEVINENGLITKQNVYNFMIRSLDYDKKLNTLNLEVLGDSPQIKIFNYDNKEISQDRIKTETVNAITNYEITLNEDDNLYEIQIKDKINNIINIAGPIIENTDLDIENNNLKIKVVMYDGIKPKNGELEIDKIVLCDSNKKEIKDGEIDLSKQNNKKNIDMTISLDKFKNARYIKVVDSRGLQSIQKIIGKIEIGNIIADEKNVKITCEGINIFPVTKIEYYDISEKKNIINSEFDKYVDESVVTLPSPIKSVKITTEVGECEVKGPTLNVRYSGNNELLISEIMQYSNYDGAEVEKVIFYDENKKPLEEFICSPKKGETEVLIENIKNETILKAETVRILNKNGFGVEKNLNIKIEPKIRAYLSDNKINYEMWVEDGYTAEGVLYVKNGNNEINRIMIENNIDIEYENEISLFRRNDKITMVRNENISQIALSVKDKNNITYLTKWFFPIKIKNIKWDGESDGNNFTSSKIELEYENAKGNVTILCNSKKINPSENKNNKAIFDVKDELWENMTICTDYGEEKNIECSIKNIILNDSWRGIVVSVEDGEIGFAKVVRHDREEVIVTSNDIKKYKSREVVSALVRDTIEKYNLENLFEKGKLECYKFIGKTPKSIELYDNLGCRYKDKINLD